MRREWNEKEKHKCRARGKLRISKDVFGIYNHWSLTVEGISITHHCVRFPNHLVRHSKVKVKSRLIFAESEQFQNDRNAGSFTVVNRWCPGCTAPKATNVRTLCFGNLQRSIGTSFRGERYEFSQSEAVKGQLRSKKNSINNIALMQRND